MYTKLIAPSLLAAAFVAMPSLADVNASGEVGYIPPAIGAPSPLTRAEVIAELMRAQREGTLAQTGETGDSGAVAAAQPEPAPALPQPAVAAR